MAKFESSYDDLKQLVSKLGFSGNWREIPNGKLFRSNDGAILNWYETTGTLTFQGDKKAKELMQEAVLSGINESGANDLSVPTLTVSKKTSHSVDPVSKERVFLVHGHDSTSLEQLELILHKLGLDPFVLANTGGGGLTIIEALESEIGSKGCSTKFGIVLLTPDDCGYSKIDGPDKSQDRARQNVVLEMGMLISAVGRKNVAILKKGNLEVPSDAQGILYIPYSSHVKETVPKLVDRLTAAGFKLDPSKITKASS